MAGTSLVTLAKRALVTLLITFARQYQVPAVVINRESPDKVAEAAFRKVARRIHPDKGDGRRGRSYRARAERNGFSDTVGLF